MGSGGAGLVCAGLAILSGCGGRQPDSAPYPADSADTAPIRAPFAAASGTEQFAYAGWLPEPATRNCTLAWTLEATPARGCPGCEYGLTVRATLDEAQNVDDGTCAAVHMDRERVLAYTSDWEGTGPALATEQEGRWYWWASAESSDTGLRWWFGWEDLQPPPPASGPDTHAGLWLTNYWNATLVFE